MYIKFGYPNQTLFPNWVHHLGSVVTLTKNHSPHQSRIMDSENNEFQLFTSLRYDPLLLRSDENSRTILNFVTPSPFYMLAYHRDRMVEAAQHFDFFEVEKRLKDGKALHYELSRQVQEEIRKTGKDEAMKVWKAPRHHAIGLRLCSFDFCSIKPPT